jgi:hypothetical protein
MADWVTKTEPPGSGYAAAVSTVTTLSGPIVDVEQMFTDLGLGRGGFDALTEGERGKLEGNIRRCLRAFFLSIRSQDLPACLYATFATTVEAGDALVTFNYDVAVENELIHAQRFRVRDGYGSGFEADWDEPNSNVTVLKLHGSINWIGVLFGGAKGGHIGTFNSSLGPRPFVDNVDSMFPGYPKRVLDKGFPGGGVVDGATTLLLPTYEKRFFIKTSVGNEWIPFYESLWSQAAAFLEKSDRIVIIGYSMPAADHDAREMLLSKNSRGAEIFVSSLSSNESLGAQFRDHGFARVHQLGGFGDWLSQAAIAR